MTLRRWLRSIERRTDPTGSLTPEAWAVLFEYGSSANHYGPDTADRQLLADRETDHRAKVSEGCGGCDLLARLLYAWLADQRVGDPDTWHVYAVSPEHVTAWLAYWRFPEPAPDLVDAVADLFASR